MANFAEHAEILSQRVCFVKQRGCLRLAERFVCANFRAWHKLNLEPMDGALLSARISLLQMSHAWRRRRRNFGSHKSGVRSQRLPGENSKSLWAMIGDFFPIGSR